MLFGCEVTVAEVTGLVWSIEVSMGGLGQTFLLFFGCGTGPKRSGAVLACFWTDFQTKPSILDLIRAVFDDLGPSRHFGPDFEWARPGPRPSTSHTWRPRQRPTWLKRSNLACGGYDSSRLEGEVWGEPPQQKKV